MDGRQKTNPVGIIRSNLPKLAATWITNIKQDSAGQPTQEIISHEQDHQIHVLHRADKHNHHGQAVAEAEVVAEEVVEVVVVEVEVVEAEAVEAGVKL